MASFIGRIFGALAGGGGDAPAAGAVSEYKGYTISAAPKSDGGQWITAGTISREIDGETRVHDFVRADRHADREAAVAYSEKKAHQIIDEQGDAIFRQA